MPNNIIDMVANQHNPELAIDTKSASLVHIANRQANELEIQISNQTMGQAQVTAC